VSLQQRVELARGGIVGRETELAAVAAFLDPTAPRPAALVIEGEPGIGKTTIVRAALEQASAAGVRVLAARPAAGEAELPYVGLGDLLGFVDTAALMSLASRQRAAIEAALAREGSSEVVDGSALSRGVLELLRLEGTNVDLLLAIDDVQWLDRPSIAALTFALRRLGRVPVRVLVAARTTDGVAAELPLGLADWECVSRVAVGPLSATALGALLRERLGESLPRPRLNALRHASGGNPMFALELAKHTQDATFQSPSPTLPLALEERLRTLPADTRTVLSVAAAALRPTPDLLLQAGVERAALRSALDTGVLALDGERLSFAHPLLASSAYQLVLPDERREIHARLAAASSDPVERGHHVSRSVIDPDEVAAAELDRAAEEAASLGDHAGAAGFLLRAAELSTDPDGDVATRRALEAAAEHVLAGDVGAGAALCRSLIQRLPTGVARARARNTLVYCTVGEGLSYLDCVSELELALRDAQSDQAMQAELHLGLSEVYLGMCALDAAVSHAQLAIELAERGAGTAVSALAALGFAESMLGRGVTDAARQALERWDGTIGWSGSPRMSLACVCIPVLAFREAEELFEQEVVTAQELGLESVEVEARAHLAEVQLRAGRWAEGLTNARLAVEHARQATEPQIVTGTSSILAMADALLGQHEQARVTASESLVTAEAIHDFWFTVSHRAVLGLVALADDEPQRAVDVLEPAWRLMLERQLGDLSLFPVAQVLGEALVAVGRVADAEEIAEKLNEAPIGAQPWCRAMGRRLQALAAATRGEHDAASSAIADALEIQGALPEPFEYARSLHIQGRLERSARRWGAARTAFAAALERFDQLGAARWAEKTTADIARLPGRRPAGKQALTTREQEVAELVAAGLTNKEIAARLFVSISTVEASLSRVYGKLGVRSRTELAGRHGRSNI
jgi:DNA-binding CsgD family transcriptional regulator